MTKDKFCIALGAIKMSIEEKICFPCRMTSYLDKAIYYSRGLCSVAEVEEVFDAIDVEKLERMINE